MSEVDNLEELARSFEQQAKMEAALDTWRQALEKEGRSTERGQRFAARIAELEAMYRSGSAGPSWWQNDKVRFGLLGGVIAVLALAAVLPWVLPHPAPPVTVVVTAMPTERPLPNTPRWTPLPTAAPVDPIGGGGSAADVVRQNYDALAAHDWSRAYHLMSPALAQKLQGSGELEHTFATAHAISVIETKTTYDDGKRSDIEATVEMTEDNDQKKTSVIPFSLVKDDGQWRIDKVGNDSGPP